MRSAGPQFRLSRLMRLAVRIILQHAASILAMNKGLHRTQALARYMRLMRYGAPLKVFKGKKEDSPH